MKKYIISFCVVIFLSILSYKYIYDTQYQTNGNIIGNNPLLYSNMGDMKKYIQIDVSQDVVFQISGLNLSFHVTVPTSGGVTKENMLNMPLDSSGNTIRFCGTQIEIFRKEENKTTKEIIEKISAIANKKDCIILSRKKNTIQEYIISDQKTSDGGLGVSSCGNFGTNKISEEEYSKMDGMMDPFFFENDTLGNILISVAIGQDPACGSRRETVKTIE